jgi:hypothetical protein
MAPGAKNVPFKVNVKPASPTLELVGEIEVNVGVVAGDTVIVNGNTLEAV